MDERPSDPSAAAVRRAVVPVYGLTVLGTLAWLAAIVLAPYLESRGFGSASSFIYAVFSPTCHQIPARSFFFCGFPLAVCGRCFGIYSGFLAGLVFYPVVRGWTKLALPSARLFALLSIPIGCDFAAGFIGLWTSTNAVRFATGVLWGAILPFYFVTGLAELVLRRPVRAWREPSSVAPASDLDNSGQKNVK